MVANKSSTPHHSITRKQWFYSLTVGINNIPWEKTIYREKIHYTLTI